MLTYWAVRNSKCPFIKVSSTNPIWKEIPGNCEYLKRLSRKEILIELFLPPKPGSSRVKQKRLSFWITFLLSKLHIPFFLDQRKSFTYFITSVCLFCSLCHNYVYLQWQISCLHFLLLRRYSMEISDIWFLCTLLEDLLHISGTKCYSTFNPHSSSVTRDIQYLAV